VSGLTPGGVLTPGSELYNPVTGTWTATGSLCGWRVDEEDPAANALEARYNSPHHEEPHPPDPAPRLASLG